MIRVENLTVRFSQLTAVREVSFSVGEGEAFGLVGESGSGKSTVLRTIMGLNSSWSGEITVDGKPIRQSERKTFARLAQMVFQDPYASLHPRFAIGQIIAEPMKLHGFSDIGARTDSLLEMIGLDPAYRFRFPHELSGGQRQRVAIARALALEPRLLVLDEPTSALDVSIQAEILNLLNRLRRELNLTFLLVSHDLAVVSYMCDHLAIMRNAQIVEVLSREDLRQRNLKHAYSRELLQSSLEGATSS